MGRNFWRRSVRDRGVDVPQYQGNLEHQRPYAPSLPSRCDPASAAPGRVPGHCPRCMTLGGALYCTASVTVLLTCPLAWMGTGTASPRVAFGGTSTLIWSSPM